VKKVRANCPLCKLNSYKLVYYKKVWGGNSRDKFLICNKCDIVFLNPMPSDKELNKFYSDNYGRYMKERSLEQNWSNLIKELQIISKREIPLRKKILKKYLLNGSICDVGSSTGMMLEYFKDLKRTSHGIEPSKEHRSFSLSKKHTVFRNFKSVKRKYKNVLNYYVLEHINDPLKFIKSLLNITKDNGRVIIEVPNRNDYLFCNTNISSYKNFIMQKMHTLYFSKKSLIFLLNKLEFSFKIIGNQRYEFNNHLNWALNKSPGNIKYIFQNKFSKYYKNYLIKNNYNDYFVIIIDKRKKIL